MAQNSFTDFIYALILSFLFKSIEYISLGDLDTTLFLSTCTHLTSNYNNQSQTSLI